jgi:antitoxin MazE
MRSVVRRWGNSLGVRIPRALAEGRLEEGTEVDISTAGGAILIEPVGPSYSLEQLLARVTPDNVHAETDVGEPVGRELW